MHRLASDPMARLIKHTAQRPHILEIGGEKKALCACGLSKNYPFCDGSHRFTADEVSGKVYTYDADGKRTEVKN